MWNAIPPTMSEFKFACPICGQHMKCDSSQSGTVMECPTCFQKITAPQAPESDDSKFIITGTKTGDRPIPSALLNAGMIPVPELAKKSPVAIIAFVVLFCAAVVALFAFGGKIFNSAAPPEIAPGSNSVSPSQPAPVTYTLNLSSVGSDGNFALNKPASASSSQDDQNPAQNGNDGNVATRWCAADGTVPQWWEVDLGGAITITNTQVTWESVSIYQYQI